MAEELMLGEVDGNISYNRNYTKSGKIVHCVWYNSVIKDDSGNIMSVMSQVQDITEQKRHEQEIIESRKKLTNIVNNLPGFVYRCKNDRNWTSEYVSNTCKEVLGYESDDLIGNKRLAFSDLIHPDDREMVWEEIQSALKKNQQYELSYKIIDKAGKEKWVWEKGMGIEDKPGNIIALEGFIQDITAQKKAERVFIYYLP